jgi:hypothetical protein
LATSATPAAAQDPLPDNNAGTGEYVEPVPDAEGDRRATPGPGPRRGSLPPGVRDDLPPGEEGRVLERLATDPGSGAPDDRGDRARDGGVRGRDGSPEDEEGPISAVTGAAVDSGGPGILILVVAVVTLALTAAGVRRRRRT